MPERIDEIIERWRRVSGDKSRWHPHYDDLARVLLPRRLGFASTTIEGERRTDDIYDGTPMQSARALANAIGGMLRPGGLPDVEMQADDDAINQSEEALTWFADSERRLAAAFNNPKARFRQSSGEIDADLVVFGTAALFVGATQSRLKFRAVALKDATPQFDEDGAPDGMYLKRSMPARHLRDRFGEGRLSERTREILKRTPEQKIDILHAVLPRADGRADALFSRNLPYSDLWIEIEAKHELSQAGYHELPFIVPRWDTSSGEDMGRSPGMIALPDSDTLQAMGETILIAGQRAADPPLAVPNDGVFDAANTFPGGLTYYDVETATAMRGNPFFPIESGMSLPISRDMQADIREQVRAAFFRNVLNLPIDGPQMTATEIIERKEEFIRELGPIFGRLETDYTAPMVERAFMLMLRAGGFLPIPQVLSEQNIRFEYESPVKRIRQQIEAAAARMWAMELFEMGQIRPEAIDLVNVDALGRFSADALGIPKQIVNSAETVEGIRAARQEAMQAQQDQMAVAQAAQVADTVAGAAQKAGAAGGLAEEMM